MLRKLSAILIFVFYDPDMFFLFFNNFYRASGIHFKSFKTPAIPFCLTKY